MEVVKTVARAVGSDAGMANGAYDHVNESVAAGRADSIQEAEADSGLVMGSSRGKDATELPVFYETEGQSGLDVPTFLRRQAD